MHELPDYYAILGVSRTATQEDIRRAYQQAALRCHPDRNNQSREATEEFQRLADAYYVLGDKHRRHAYDVATQTHRPFTGAAQHVNAENVFVDAFEELLRPEVERPGWFWWLVGTIAGFLLGMIIANFLGAIMGAYIGGKLGSIRDNKGKPVYDVFMSMQRDQRFRILQGVAARVLL